MGKKRGGSVKRPPPTEVAPGAAVAKPTASKASKASTAKARAAPAKPAAVAAAPGANWAALKAQLGAGKKPKRRVEGGWRGRGAPAGGRGDGASPPAGAVAPAAAQQGEAPAAEKKLVPLSGDASATRFVAMDCEMVGVGPGGCRSALARVSLVNDHGNVLLDTFVGTAERVTDYRTEVSGVRPQDLRGAPSLADVRGRVEQLLAGRVLVGHALRNDLKALMLSHPKKDIRDTALYRMFTRKAPRVAGEAHHKGEVRGRRPRKLRDLVWEHLGVRVQEGEHSSVEDARCALYLYHKVRQQWEAEARR